MKPNDQNHEIDSNTDNEDKLGRKVYFNIDEIQNYVFQFNLD